MRTHQRFLGLSFSALLLYPPGALACSYAEPPSLNEVVEAAEHVFILRMEVARFRTESCGESCTIQWAEAEISPLLSLKGASEPTTRMFRWVPGWCGGQRFDVGELYVAFLSEDHREVQLAPGEQRLLHVTGRVAPDRLEESPFVEELRKAVREGKLPSGYPSRTEANRTTEVPLPPEPLM
jgi:hypothetical protein